MTWKQINSTPKHQLIILLLLAFGLNINTIFNEYVLDDDIVIAKNTVVQKGFKGIPEILTTDIYYGCKELTATLSEPRYRPFTLVVFAMEYQIFGKNPFISHFINVLLFTLLMALLYQLLEIYIFKEQHPSLAFVTCLLFVVHPIHTEVIANVKSRDELITFILLIVSAISFIKYLEKKSIRHFLISIICFFLALLTRESAVTFVATLPLILFFFYKQPLKQALLQAIPWLLTVIIYLALRFYMIGINHNTPALNVYDSPFLYATASEAFATKIFILIKYLGLLFFPHPLSWDYGYNQIPYIPVTSGQFIFSFVFLLGLLAFALLSLKKKSILSFSILYFFITISLFSNLVVDVGTPLSERFLFQPSLAFCIMLAFFYVKYAKKFKVLVNSLFLIILFLFSIKTLARNTDWRANDTLMITDVSASPNSLRTNKFALGAYLNKANKETNPELKNKYFLKAVNHGEYALKLMGDNPEIKVDLGNAYLGLSDYFKSADYFFDAYKLNPETPEAKQRVDMLSDILYNEGNNYYRKKETATAIDYYKKSVELNSLNIDAWYNLAKIYFKLSDTKNGMEAWQHVLKLDTKHQFNKIEF